MTEETGQLLAAFVVGMYAGVAFMTTDFYARVLILVLTAILFAVWIIANLRERQKDEADRKRNNCTR